MELEYVGIWSIWHLVLLVPVLVFLYFSIFYKSKNNKKRESIREGILVASFMVTLLGFTMLSLFTYTDRSSKVVEDFEQYYNVRIDSEYPGIPLYDDRDEVVQLFFNNESQQCVVSVHDFRYSVTCDGKEVKPVD